MCLSCKSVHFQYISMWVRLSVLHVLFLCACVCDFLSSQKHRMWGGQAGWWWDESVCQRWTKCSRPWLRPSTSSRSATRPWSDISATCDRPMAVPTMIPCFFLNTWRRSERSTVSDILRYADQTTCVGNVMAYYHAYIFISFFVFKSLFTYRNHIQSLPWNERLWLLP